MDRNNVIWKEYYFNGTEDKDIRFEFSNYGEVKSFNLNSPNGRLITGGLQGGYPIIRFKILGEMDEVSSSILENLQKEIDALRSEIKEKKALLKKKSTTYDESRKIERSLIPKKESLDKILKKSYKERAKINKKRSIYYQILVHKAVAELFIPNDNPEEKPFVIHLNYDKQDNRVENLAWATKEEVIEHGRKSPKWIEHNLKLERRDRPKRDHAKLTYSDVVFIKRKLDKGETMARLARRFGVSSMQIHRIKTGENWGDVKLTFSKEEKELPEVLNEVQN